MKAARFYKEGDPLRIEDVEIPKIGSREVLVKVKACGVTPSNIPYRKMIPALEKVPVTYGHQIAGTIAEVGSDVTGINKGNRVFVEYYVGCGQCPMCRSGRDYICPDFRVIGKTWGDGGFAEYVRVPVNNIFPLPDEISFEEGALIADPIGVGFHAARRAGVQPNNSVAIFGGGGAVGIATVQCAKLAGADPVIAIDAFEHKLKIAKKVGADEIVNSSEGDPVEKIKSLTGDKGVDIAIDACGGMGSAGELGGLTYEQSMKSTRWGGRTVIIGCSWETFTCEALRFCLEEFEVLGSHGVPKSDLPTIVSLIVNKKIQVKPIISHFFSLDEINHALDVLHRGLGDPFKIIIRP
jgi:threonine dehydrogenase-like Zn-dependent dehydrogenase